jgi:MFS family permease
LHLFIFSQLTNWGIGNYGLKKLLPRLIIAAILVNVSYLISALAVDLSNIVGSNLQDVLVGIRGTLDGPNTVIVPSWESTVSFILATGTGLAAAGAAIGGIAITTGASMGAALILLLPLLLSVLLAALVALIVLAARQALIIILIIIAPLAFVAFLLPNTEKLFDRWRGLFTTMLIFFPLFSLIFGGSQLAAFLLIQTASGGNAINIILLALFVQVAPLVLTPLLIRFSGGIIGRIAGMVNDPKKGFVDKTRNWAKQQSEYMAAKNMARTDPVSATTARLRIKRWVMLDGQTLSHTATFSKIFVMRKITKQRVRRMQTYATKHLRLPLVASRHLTYKFATSSCVLITRKPKLTYSGKTITRHQLWNNASVSAY